MLAVTLWALLALGVAQGSAHDAPAIERLETLLLSTREHHAAEAAALRTSLDALVRRLVELESRVGFLEQPFEPARASGRAAPRTSRRQILSSPGENRPTRIGGLGIETCGLNVTCSSYISGDLFVTGSITYKGRLLDLQPTFPPTEPPSDVPTPAPSPPPFPLPSGAPIPIPTSQPTLEPTDYPFFVSGVGDWSTCKSNCASSGGVLSCPKSDRDLTLMTTLCPGGGGCWVGITDSASEGTWMCADGSPVTYTNWGSGEPNNHPHDSNGEDCAVFYVGGTWIDLPCWYMADSVCICGHT